MIIGLLTVRLSIPDATSLKDKRRVVRSLKDRTVAHMNVSVAEVGSQDYCKTAELAFVTVAAQRNIVEKRLSGLSAKLQSDPRYVLLDLHTEYL